MLIVDMPMPKGCPCELSAEVFDPSGNYGGHEPCFAWYGIPARSKEFDRCVVRSERPSWCPIVGELPEQHGDLIDRDKFADKYIRHYTEQERKMNLVFAAVEVKQDFADMIYEEDAVIAAERKDDE